MWRNTRNIETSTKKHLKLSPQNGSFPAPIKGILYDSSLVLQSEHNGDSTFLSLKSILFTKKNIV